MRTKSVRELLESVRRELSESNLPDDVEEALDELIGVIADYYEDDPEEARRAAKACISALRSEFDA